MENLILTGWGWKDYACAAALALRKYPDSDVLGMSTRRLPEFLDEVNGYQQIILLGIGLTGNPELLLKALTRLHSKGVRLHWLSALPFPESLSEEIRSKLDVFFMEADTLTDVVSHYFQIPYDDIKPLIFSENRFGNRELVGKSAAMQDLQERINRIAPRDHARVLIFGESGTGKETVALQIHNKSPRRNEPYVAFNCASVTPNLLESRFFGHERGAFTGATEMKRGLFEQANGGTLFLDEIGELPLEAQGILLRVLEGGRFTRMGGNTEIEINVRLIAATNRDLAAMVRDGKFREDLFHRLNVVQILVPPLRDHKSDIEQIANGYWLKQHRHRLETEQIEALKEYDYPGNVRELFNLLERASVLDQMDFSQLIREHRSMMASLAPVVKEEIPDELDAAIRLHVRRVYEKYNNNLSRTAAALKAARNTVRKYLEE